MQALLEKLKASLRKDGLWKTSAKCGTYPVRRLANVASDRWRRWQLSRQTPAEAFSRIYQENLWGDGESASGAGSTLLYTENLRRHLPQMFSRFSIKAVYDAPCGDFNWMKQVVADNDISYHGSDIVPALIESHQQHQKPGRVSFSVADISRDPPPKADVWICRDCLFHLSNHDIYRALNNFASSGVPYILTTTHLNPAGFANSDIPSGHFRLIDLFAHPYYLPKEVKFRVDDYIGTHPPREMCLWTREQIVEALPRMKAALKL